MEIGLDSWVTVELLLYAKSLRKILSKDGNFNLKAQEKLLIQGMLMEELFYDRLLDNTSAVKLCMPLTFQLQELFP